MRAVVCGANGAMGKLICAALGDAVIGKVSIDGENGVPKTFEELGPVDANVLIDFSHHTAVGSVLAYAKKIGCAAVIGTTGHTPEEKAMIFAAAEEIPVFYAGNVSLGIAVLCRLVKEAVKFFPEADIEIVEIHHTRKVDAPSGTAHMLFNAVKEVRADAVENCGRSGEGKRTKDEIGVHALRGGTVTGEHEVCFFGTSERVKISHSAENRSVFAAGALRAAEFLVGQKPGMYTMDDVVGKL
mgnify:CR=1 FL=1